MQLCLLHTETAESHTFDEYRVGCEAFLLDQCAPAGRARTELILPVTLRLSAQPHCGVSLRCSDVELPQLLE
jgi:hypothetical protein